MAHPMFVKHQDLLSRAVHAIESRGWWAPYAENAHAYGTAAFEDGKAAFEAYLDAQFYLDQPGVVGRGGGETSPFGFALNVSYPKCSADALIAAGKTAMPNWLKAGPDVRAGVCAEILARLNAGSIEIAHAVMHTTGQSFTRAFQDGGPQAQALGLEAVACAWREMKHVPYYATWEKPQGVHAPLKLQKRYALAARGVALVLSSAGAPTRASYAGLFASLATGNAVIIKPHPAAILPLAITVAVARQTLKDAGFDAGLVSLLVDTAEVPIARETVVKPEIRIIDYAGDAEFGRWLEDNARQALLFSDKAGINSVLIDSTSDYVGMLKELAIALSLNSGQNSQTPRLLFLPEVGVGTPAGTVKSEMVVRDLASAIGRLVEDPGRALEVLGAIRSRDTLKRLEALEMREGLVRATNKLRHPQWPDAAVRTPLLLKASIEDAVAWAEQCEDPLGLIVETATTAESLAIAERVMRQYGASAFSVYSTNENVVELAVDAGLRSGVPLWLNPVGGAFLNQGAAFSDLRVGANDAAFVASRFCVSQSNRLMA